MWLYEGKEITEEQTVGFLGFVYLIENLKTGKRYIGKKLLTKAATKQVKGKKKKIRKASDWATYFGSSKSLLEDVALLGQENFRRTILRLCATRGQCSYFEAKYQFEHGVLEHTDLFYNEQIMCRVHRRHLKL